MSESWRKLSLMFLGMALTLSLLSHGNFTRDFFKSDGFDIPRFQGGAGLLVLGQKIPLNQAGARDLAALDGLGPMRSQRVVDYRKSHGPFRSLEELKKVSGIGEETLKKIRPFLSLN